MALAVPKPRKPNEPTLSCRYLSNYAFNRSHGPSRQDPNHNAEPVFPKRLLPMTLTCRAASFGELYLFHWYFWGADSDTSRPPRVLVAHLEYLLSVLLGLHQMFLLFAVAVLW